MTSNSPFSLTSDCVPSPPVSTQWADVLRWLVMVMDPQDTRLSFIAGLLSHTLKHGGLTDRQSAAGNKIWHAIQADFRASILVCQNTQPVMATTNPDNIRTLN